MRIDRLFLRNYRVFEDALELEMPGGLVGIVGPNGAGKSTLLESILFGLYGKARTSKDEIRTAGVRGDCMVELEFEHEGHLYLVRRSITGAANTVKAEVSADRMKVADGVTDTRRYLQSILGMDEAAFRASVFAEQKQLAAFSTDVRPEQRRKLVLSLLGITPLEAARDLARKDARQAHESFERLRAMLQDLGELGARADLAAATAERLAAEAAAEDEVAARARGEVAAAEAELERLDDVRREHDRLVADGKAVRDELDRAEAAIRRLEAELAGLAGAAARLSELQAEAAGVEALEARLPLVTAALDRRRQLDAIRVPPPPEEPDDRRAAAAAEAVRRSGEALAEARTQLRFEEQRAKAAGEEIAAAAALSGAADCPTCGQPLGQAFEQVQEHRRAEQAAAFEAVERQRRAVADHQRAHDEAEAAAAAEAAALDGARTAWAAFERERSRRADAEAALAAAVAPLGGVEPSPDEAAALAEEVSRRRKAADECRALEGQLRRRPVAEADLAEAAEHRREAEGRRAVLLDKVHALGFDPAAHDTARTARDRARTRARSADEAARAKQLDAARAAADAAAAAEALAAARAQHDRIADLESTARHLERTATLLNAFRTNVITAIGPRLSAQAADLFGELTDHEYDRLEIDPETYEIRIHDAGRPYGMTRFSGSETDLANLALRVAISEHVTFQSGGAVGLLVLDEVFGSLDDDRRERMLVALERLRARFRQILVVTHATEVKEQLPTAVEVVKLPGRRATARVMGV